MADIWVSPLGSNSNSGLSRTTPKATIAAGYAALSSGATLHLLPGSYVDDCFITITKNSFIKGEGNVRIVCTDNLGVIVNLPNQIPAAFYVGLNGNFRTVLHGLRFENYTNIVQDWPAGTTAAQCVSTFQAKHCVFSRPALTGGLFDGHVAAFRENRGCGGGVLQLWLENCTFLNWIKLFYVQAEAVGPTATFPNGISVFGMQNNLFDTYSNFLYLANAIAAGGSAYTYIRFTVTDPIQSYNAYSGSTGIGGIGVQLITQSGTGASFYNHQGFTNETGAQFDVVPEYTDLSSSPPDLAIDPTSGSSLLTGGYLGASIGAAYWPIVESSTHVFTGGGGVNDVPGTTWAGWINDERWFDTGGGVPGVDGPVGASPAILAVPVSGDQPVFQINQAVGGGVSARALGPVVDMGENMYFSATHWQANETNPNKRISADQNYTEPSPGTQIEVRASATSFTATATSPAWQKVSRTQRPDIEGRYWQTRVTLRTDAT